MTEVTNHPAKIGKYEVEKVLGQGAMGIVYRAFDPFIKREVAIKVIHKDLMMSSSGEEVSMRFKLEAQAAGRFSPHNNIVTVYEFGEEDGCPFIVMEYVKGKTLKDWLEEKTSFSLQNIYSIMSQLLNGLHYSHENNVVHRDIKPENLFLLHTGQLKISDFGIAKIDQTGVTQHGIRIGTPSFMSPEQIEGKTVDGRSDLFSAGVILYQLLTGRKPFSGESLASLMHQVVNTEPASVCELNAQLPKAIDAVVKKALAKNLADRFQNGHEFAVAIKEAFDNQSARQGHTGEKKIKPFVFAAAGVALLLVGGIIWVTGGEEPVKQEASSVASLPSTSLPSLEKNAVDSSAVSPSGQHVPEPIPPEQPALTPVEELAAMAERGVIEEIEQPQPNLSAPLAYVPDVVEPEKIEPEEMVISSEDMAVLSEVFQFEARGYYTSTDAVMNELRDGETLTPSDNYYFTYKAEQELYLYVAQVDSQGYIYPIFPNFEFSPVVNPLSGGREFRLPEDNNFYLDFNVGKEQIYFLASTSRLESIELMFDEIKGGDNARKKELAGTFVGVFQSYDEHQKQSIWFYHK